MQRPLIVSGGSFLRNERALRLFAYVKMEDHIHAMLQGDDWTVKVGRFKSYTARKIIDLLEDRGCNCRLRHFRIFKKKHKHDRKHQFWQEGFHPKEMVGDARMQQKIEYIHQNPVKRDYVEKPNHWRYSSARKYLDMQVLIPVDCYARRRHR